MENVRETVLDDVDEVTELSEPILSAALLTDRGVLEIYGDIGLLMNALTRIGWTVAETKKSLEKEP